MAKISRVTALEQELLRRATTINRLGAEVERLQGLLRTYQHELSRRLHSIDHPEFIRLRESEASMRRQRDEAREVADRLTKAHDRLVKARDEAFARIREFLDEGDV